MTTSETRRSVDLADVTIENIENIADDPQCLRLPPDQGDVKALARINVHSGLEHLLVPNYAEDEIVRHATLEPNSWFRYGDFATFQRGNLHVCMVRDGRSISPDEVATLLERAGIRTLLTLRIAMGLWNLRRSNLQLCRNGSVAIRIDEILTWLGIKKHRKTVDSGKRTDGWRPEEYARVAEDLRLAATFTVVGSRRVKIKGKFTSFDVDAQYIRVSYVSLEASTGSQRPFGIFFSPGDWFNFYTENHVYFLAPMSRRIFDLHPQNDQHAIRIALFLMEYWRKRAEDRTYTTPMSIEDLLRESAIELPATNGSRFIRRIEGALTTLQEKDIIGNFERLESFHQTSPSSFNGWLASKWQITPPHEIVNALNQGVRTRSAVKRR